MFGRDGLSLTQKWSTGMRTMHGMQTRSFPNLFIMGPQQRAFTVNYPHLLDEQAKHITYILTHATENKIKTFEPSEAAESQWVDTIIAFSFMQFLKECTPGYYNNEGNLSNLNAQNSFFGGGSILFFQMLQQWRDEGTLKGLELQT
jgi:cyclohexanone monooxygenase